MAQEFLKRAHGQLITEGRVNLRHRIQYFVEKASAESQALISHAEIVEQSAVSLQNTSLTKRFSYLQEGRTQVVTGRIRGEQIEVSTRDTEDKRFYSATVNNEPLSDACAKDLWDAFGVPTRRRHITASRMERQAQGK